LVPVGNGFVRGEGTWIYLETNGQPGLQRGGVSTLPTLKVAVIGTGANDPEICSGQSTTPDELVF